MIKKRCLRALALVCSLFTVFVNACSDVSGDPPSVPFNVSANVLFRNEVEITWSASTDNVPVAGYRLFRDGTLVASVPGTAATDSGLSAFSLHAYKVTSLDGSGNESGTSTSVPVRTLRYSTFIGTAALDSARTVAQDVLGNIYIAGNTTGSLGQNQGNLGGTDFFIAKFDTFLNLQWVVQYGTGVDDSANAIAISGMTLYIAGHTRGLIGTQPFTAAQGGTDCFIMRLDTATGQVQGDIVQFGTPQDDTLLALAVDRGNSVVAAGYTRGSLYATNAGPANTADIIVVKYSTLLAQTPVWKTQFGSAGNDQVNALAIDNANNIYIAGSWNNGNVYVTRLDADGNRGNEWLYSNSLVNEATGIAVDDSQQSLYVTGSTHGPFLGNTAIGDLDLFVVKLSVTLPASPASLWSRQFGSGAADLPAAITLKSASEVLVAGTTSGSFYDTNRGGTDLFITNLDAATGNTLQGWGRQFGTTRDDVVSGMIYDRARNAGFLAGSIRRSSTDSDATVLRFDPFGSLQ